MTRWMVYAEGDRHGCVVRNNAFMAGWTEWWLGFDELCRFVRSGVPPRRIVTEKHVIPKRPDTEN